MKKIVSIAIVLSLLLFFTGCGKKEEAKTQVADVNPIGAWDNEEASTSAIFEEDKTVRVVSESSYVLYTYFVDGENISFTGPSDDMKGTLKNGVLTIEGIEGTFKSVSEPTYDVDGTEGQTVVDEDDEEVDLSFWYGEYTSDNGTLTIESSVIDNAVDFSFDMNDGYYSGTWRMETEDASVVEDSYIVAYYNEDDESIRIDLVDGDEEEFESIIGTYYAE